MGELKKNKKRKTKKVDYNDRNHVDEDDGSPKARTIHIIMRDDEDDEKGKKISEIERKNMKKQFLNIMNEFPEDEGGFEDS